MAGSVLFLMLLLSLLVHRFARVLAAVECFQGLSDTATIAMAPGVSVAPVVALENDLGLLLLLRELQPIYFISVAPLDEGPALDALSFA